MSELTRVQFSTHLREMAEAKRTEGYYAYRDAVLAHDAALRAKVEALEQELNEQREISDWYGSLVKRAQIGTNKTPSLRAYIEQTESERDRLREAAQDMVDSFEMDYMIDGVIVDNPRGPWGRLYRVCKAALRGEGG